MTLSTRLTILLVTITALVALCVGWFAVAESSRSQYASLDDSINAVVASGQGHPFTALSAALYVVQADNDNLTLDVVSPTDKITQINAGLDPLVRRPTLANVRDSLTQVTTAANLGDFRFRSLNVGAGDYLVVAGSTAAITTANHQLEARVALAGLVAAAVMALVARLFMRRDLRSIDHLIAFAGAVAAGDEQVEAPPAQGSTDLRDLQASLRAMVEALRATIAEEKDNAQVMQRFIGDASHELRTPLTVVRGYGELLENPDLSSEQRGRALERIRREVDRMDGLVGDLLFLAEVAEAPHPDASEIDLGDLVAAQVRDFATDHPARTVTSSIAPGGRINGRRDRVQRLVANALANVARHTPDDAPVRVTLESTPDRVTLVIEDGGPGLPDAAYGLTPQRFQRFDDSRSRESGGSGLGMSIMADVATSLGGSMSTSRSDLGGLRLTFALPAIAPR